MTLGQLCNRDVVTVTPEESVLEAARRMRTHHVGSVIIVQAEDGRRVPAGVVTDRDIVVGVLATASPYLERLQVGDLVIAPLVCAPEEERVEDALKTMRAHGIRRMPVVDESGCLVGIVSFDDLVRQLAEELTDLAALVASEQERERERRI